MFVSGNTLVRVAEVTAIGLAGGWITKTIARGTLYFWYQCSDKNSTITPERKKNQEKVLLACKVIGLFVFSGLAVREIFSESPLAKQVTILKDSLRDLEKDFDNLFKTISDSGKKAIHDFKLKI